MKKIKLFDVAARKAVLDMAKKRELIRSRLDWPHTSDAEREQIKSALAHIDNDPASKLFAAQPTALYDALAAVNGKASAHTYNTPGDLVAIASAIERKLERHGVPLKERAGVTVTALSGVPTAKSYNRQARSAIATRVTLQRGTSAWYVTNAARVERYTGPGGDEKIAVALTDAAREAVIKNALKDFE